MATVHSKLTHRSFQESGVPSPGLDLPLVLRLGLGALEALWPT